MRHEFTRSVQADNSDEAGDEQLLAREIRLPEVRLCTIQEFARLSCRGVLFSM